MTKHNCRSFWFPGQWFLLTSCWGVKPWPYYYWKLINNCFGQKAVTLFFNFGPLGPNYWKMTYCSTEAYLVLVNLIIFFAIFPVCIISPGSGSLSFWCNVIFRKNWHKIVPFGPLAPIIYHNIRNINAFKIRLYNLSTSIFIWSQTYPIPFKYRTIIL